MSDSWTVTAGQPFTAVLTDPPDVPRIGARVEIPVTRAIVAAWVDSTLNGSILSATLDAPLDPGAYQLVWLSPEDPAVVEIMVPLIAVAANTVSGNASGFPDIDLESITPTIADVAVLEGTRTRDANTGEQRGTFDSTTYPTADQVTAVIADAVQDVLIKLPDELDPELYEQVLWAVTLRSAILVETSYYRVQQAGAPQNTTSNAPVYTAMYLDAMTTLGAQEARYVPLS